MGTGANAGAAPLIGGRYELDALIGKGGIGEVWRARHVALNSRVAIKFLQLASLDKEASQRRFTVEAQITAQLKTPYAVQVFDFGITDEGQPYLVMELLEGETLGRRLERLKRLRVRETVKLLGQAARALQHAHQLGIVHRDFKPDNIVIVKDDEGREQVKVLDFGIAKLANTLDDEVSPDSTIPDAYVPFTKTGTVLGTPLYMAPEQIRHAPDIDLRADIWAFGVVAFECLTGQPPFNGHSLVELFDRIESGQHLRASALDRRIPAAFDAWFDTACARDRSQRFFNVSVAWKQLTIALDVSKRGLSLSTSLPVDVAGFDPNATSGERARVEVLERSHDGGELKSLQRIPVRSMLGPERGQPDVASSSPLASSLGDTTDVMPPRSRGAARRGAIGAAASAVVACLFLWRWFAASGPASLRSVSAAAASASSVAPVRAQTFRLEVTSTPTGADVYGNGALLGHTPLATAVAADARALHLELRAPGYEPYARDLEATRDVEIVAQLAPLPAKAPPETTTARGRSAITPMPTAPATATAVQPDAPAPVAEAPASVAAAPATPAPAPPPATSVDPLGDRQ